MLPPPLIFHAMPRAEMIICAAAAMPLLYSPPPLRFLR